MYFGAIKKFDIADGEGIRTTLFVSGCTNRCKGCFQPETWDFCYGKPFTEETEKELIEYTKPYYVNGLTLLGGDPFEPKNQEYLLPFLKRFKEQLPDKNIWAYTGFTYEMLKTDGSYPRCPFTDEMLTCIDILVDGPFVLEKKDITLKYRGSSNQRILDMKKTLEAGRPVLWE